MRSFLKNNECSERITKSTVTPNPDAPGIFVKDERIGTQKKGQKLTDSRENLDLVS
jgi:hypothetical protein